MEMIFKLQGLDCAHCAAKLERAIGKLKTVKSASLNFMTGRLVVEAADESAADDVLKVIADKHPEVKVTRA